MSVAASYCLIKWPEADMNNVTELTAVVCESSFFYNLEVTLLKRSSVILSRECGYSLLLYRSWSKIEELLQMVIGDR